LLFVSCQTNFAEITSAYFVLSFLPVLPGGSEMEYISRICGHGPEAKYKRSNVPAALCFELEISIGTVVSWQVLDKDSAVVKVVARNGAVV